MNRSSPPSHHNSEFCPPKLSVGVVIVIFCKLLSFLAAAADASFAEA
jgi:hypothetical protein